MRNEVRRIRGIRVPFPAALPPILPLLTGKSRSPVTVDGQAANPTLDP